MPEEWHCLAKNYVSEYEASMHFARRSISTLRPLVFDPQLQAALDATYENHVLVHIRNVLARDVVSFVWKSFDTDGRAISLRKLVSPSATKTEFWPSLEEEWTSLGGMKYVAAQDGSTEAVRQGVEPRTALRRIRCELNCVEQSARFERIKRFRHSIVAHLEDPSLSSGDVNKPTYDELFDVAEQIYQLGLAAIQLFTTQAPSAHTENTQFYAAEYWAKLSGLASSDIVFGSCIDERDWLEEFVK